MKKIITGLMVLFVLLVVGCGEKAKKETPKETEIEKPKVEKLHAKYRASVFEDKDLKKFASVLAKGEEVTLEEVIKNTVKQKEVEVAKIKQADDSIVYILRRHLGGDPIVITEDNVEVKIKPTDMSDTYVRIDKGTVGFIEDTKDEWVKIYVGKVKYNNKENWLTGQWIKSGYSKDKDLVLDALKYEKAVEKLNENPEDEEAKNTIESLIDKNNIISELAAEKHLKLNSESEVDLEEEIETEDESTEIEE